MKWKDDLIYEFINQIISVKWIRKPETLWWLNRRENVFSLPCVEESYIRKVVLAEMLERTCAIGWLHARPCAGPAVSWTMRENCSPPPSSYSVLNSQGSERSCLFPGDSPPGTSVTMPTSFLRSKESGVLNGACLSLHPKNIGRSAARS